MRIFNTLMFKKGKSIAGENAGDKTKFIIRAMNGLDDAEEADVTCKMIRYLSHPHLTYFRSEEWHTMNDNPTLGEEQIKLMKEFTLHKTKK